MDTASKKYTANNFTHSSGLLSDVSVLFANWDERNTIEQNFEVAIRLNLFGKVTRHRVSSILQIFRQRYLPNDGTDRAFRLFVGSALPSEVTDRVVYYYTALAEPALYDFVCEYIYPRFLRGERSLTIRNALEFIQNAVADSKTSGKWESENTRERVAQGLLSTLRDLGVLRGVARSPTKSIAPAQLHILAFAFIAFHLKRNEPSGERLLNHPHWRLFFLSQREIEHYFAEADAEKLLTYQAAGSIIRVEFPTSNFEEYVHALIERTF